MLPSAREGDLSVMPDPVAGRVFISYRRQESSGLAGRLYDRLAARLGDDQVFIDVDTIAPGLDFAEIIAEAVSTCEVLLAIIGPRWLTATDEDGRRRLDDPDDIVRLETAAALERNIRVCPGSRADVVSGTGSYVGSRASDSHSRAPPPSEGLRRSLSR